MGKRTKLIFLTKTAYENARIFDFLRKNRALFLAFDGQLECSQIEKRAEIVRTRSEIVDFVGFLQNQNEKCVSATLNQSLFLA